MISKNPKQARHFLLELITIYQEMTQEMQKIPCFKWRRPNRISDLTQKIVTRNCLDRQIRRENELRFFKQTLQLIKTYLKKPNSSKKADIVIKYSIACEILINRLKQQLHMSKDIKDDIINQVKYFQQQCLEWAQTKKQRKQSLNSSQTKKQTDKYVLKYTFTDVTRATTTNLSRCTSPIHASPALQNEIKLNGLLQVVDAQQSQETQEPTKKHLRLERKTARPNYGYFSKTLKSSLVKKNHTTNTSIRPTENLKQKAKDLSIPQHQSLANDSIANIEQKQGNSHPSFKRNIQFFSSNRTPEGKSQPPTQEDKLLQKNTLYNVSLSHIKSRKTIENTNHPNHAHHFGSKLNKKSSEFKDQLSDCQQPSDEGSYQDVILENEPPRLRSNKRFYTRRHIPQKTQIIQPFKSQKVIPNCNPTKPQFIRSGKTSQLTISHNSSVRPSKIQLGQHHSKMISDLLKGPQLTNLRTDEIEGTEGREARNSLGKRFGDIYRELINVRKNFRQQIILKDFSVFFYQQHQLSEQQNKKIQRLLAERKTYITQFEMPVKISKKDFPFCEDYREDAYISAIRSHLTECQSLGQRGLSLD